MKKLPTLRGKIISASLMPMIFAIVLCSAVLLLIIYNVLAAYIQNDADFAMEEISDNLNNKTVFLEDILLDLRADSAVMNAMQNDGFTNSEDSDGTVALKRVSNFYMYSNKNTDQLSTPFLDMIYLFDRWGGFCTTGYTDKLRAEQQRIDDNYKYMQEQFIKSGKDMQIEVQGDHLNISYIVYTREMRPAGTLVFAINCGAVQEIMAKSSQYQDNFWFIWDDLGSAVLKSNSFFLTDTNVAELTQTKITAPHDYSTGSNGYRVHSSKLGAGLNTTIGVSSNQLFLLLFNSVKFYLLVPLILLVAVGALLFFSIVRLTKPLSEMAESLQLVAGEDFTVKLPAYDSVEFNTISSAFNTMTDTISHLINDVYQKKLLVMDSELRFLQSQMNPHFMYNVLNTIALKAKLDGNEEIYKMASSFSGLTQARLYHKDDEKIEVEQELQLVRFYLDLQKFRFEDKLSYHITVQEDALLRCLVPKLIIEFMVENAVVHGIEPKTCPGTVFVDVARENNDLVIRIEDDGVGFSGQNGVVALDEIILSERSEGHNHIALDNAIKLIRLFYGEAYGISIQSRQEVGTMVTIRIPIDKREG